MADVQRRHLGTNTPEADLNLGSFYHPHNPELALSAKIVVI
ncbi:unnamed protein product [Acidithrix sp. C25]|nr:unnamed protein product [Acidithrix sp. C25]